MVSSLTTDTIWILVCSGLVFLMQIGFCALEAGIVRTKNSINVVAKNIADLAISGVTFWLIGAVIMFSDGAIADRGQAPGDAAAWGAAILIFQILFCGTATTIVSGAVAERVRYVSYAAMILVVSIAIYPVVGKLAWQGIDGGEAGWLEAMGFIDFAGATVVHSVGGWISLAALLIIGPRIGRFDDDDHRPESSNLPLSGIGIGLLWLGWMGFNGGSTLAFNHDVAPIILNTVLGGCTGGLASMILSAMQSRHVPIFSFFNGVLGGLVAVTAGCHLFTPEAAAIVGVIGGGLVVPASRWLAAMKIDDAIDAIPVHLVAGIWGTLAVALFARDGSLAHPWHMQLGIQALGIVIAGLWAFGISWVLLRLLNSVLPLRVSPEEEESGLNVSEHNASSAMTNLISDMERHRLSGDLAGRVRVEIGSEIEPIARQYNEVAASIIRQSDKLRQAHDELVHAKTAADAANETKSRFLASMSHELRTPLNAVIGYSELMQQEMFGPLGGDGHYLEYAGTIRDAGAHLLSVVNDLLEYSRFEAGKAELVEELVTPARVLESAIRFTSEAAKRKGLSLSCDAAATLPVLSCDERLLRQIVLNLLSNAIKFTEEGGAVALKAMIEPDGRMAVQVRDTGIGMTRDEVTDALEPFRQLNDSYASKTEGTGLGLALVKAMTDLHQASLTIESEKDEGTTVTVRFPVDRVGETAD